jgi:hypothetical protein
VKQEMFRLYEKYRATHRKFSVRVTLHARRNIRRVERITRWSRSHGKLVSCLGKAIDVVWAVHAVISNFGRSIQKGTETYLLCVKENMTSHYNKMFKAINFERLDSSNELIFHKPKGFTILYFLCSTPYRIYRTDRKGKY